MAASAEPASGDERFKKGSSREVVVFQHAVVPLFQGLHKCWMERISNYDGKDYASGMRSGPSVSAWESSSFTRELLTFKKDAAAFRHRYPDVAIGDLVPLFGPIDGAVYRVESLAREGGVTSRERRDHVKLKRMAESELREDLRVQADSYAISLRGFGWLRGAEIQVKEISKEDGRPVAKVEVSPLVGGTNLQTLHAGDPLQLHECAYEVRNIVCPSLEQQVVGWIEIDPFPVDKTDGRSPR